MPAFHPTDVVAVPPSSRLAIPASPVSNRLTTPSPTVRIVRWEDPVADPLGLAPHSRYVELYWLGIIGPSTTWLLRRLAYGLEMQPAGFDLHMADTARALGLGDRMGRNAPFRRALARLVTFELARAHGPDELAVRTSIPPLPLRHLAKLPESLQRGHRQWQAEQRLPQAQQIRHRAVRLATGLAEAGRTRDQIEQQLGHWHFHPAVAFQAAEAAVASDGASDRGRTTAPRPQPGSAS